MDEACEGSALRNFPIPWVAVLGTGVGRKEGVVDKFRMETGEAG